MTKEGRSGRLRFLTVRHELRQAGELAVVDEQDLVYRRPPGPAAPTDAAPAPDAPGTPEGTPSGREAALALQIDEALLFRFSALTYNGHRIHYDREWCRHEGYADLVVHGPLQAPMLGTGRLDVVAAPGGLGLGAEAYGAGRRTAACTVV